MKRIFHRLAVLAALAVLPVAAQGLPSVPGEAAWTPKAAADPRLRLATAKASGARLVLAPLPDSALEELREANFSRKRLLIGVTRAVGAEAAPADPAWSPVKGGHALRLELTSPEAASLRLALDLKGLPGDVEMVFFGSDGAGRLEGPVRVADIPDRSEAWWSPITEGATQTIEFFAPAQHDPAALSPRIERASHIFTTPSSRFAKRTQDIGDAGSCNIDIKCSSLTQQTSFREAVASVAQMVFTDGGFTGLCTGTLLNDVDPATQVPWFYSANHCFDNNNAPYKTAAQIQSVASTLSTLWFFEASACRSLVPDAGWVQQSSGATHLYNNVQSDVLFVRLNAAPPSGSFFAAWDANPLGANAAVITIHHPQGDLKKVTPGRVLRFSSPGVGGGNASFIENLWTEGTTEPGSSGAGLWSVVGSSYAFRGGLWGGTALCTNPTGTDNYSRLDQAYANLAQYLSPTSTPIADFTDLWWNPAENGWGLSIVQHSSRLFAVWFTYGLDGKRIWFVLPSGTWTSSRVYTGAIYGTTGPAANATFNAANVTTTPIGTATLTFADANSGTFAYTINGLAGTKSISRQPY